MFLGDYADEHVHDFGVIALAEIFLDDLEGLSLGQGRPIGHGSDHGHVILHHGNDVCHQGNVRPFHSVRITFTVVPLMVVEAAWLWTITKQTLLTAQ